MLDLLVAQRDAFPGVHMVHAEIYVDPEHALSSGYDDRTGRRPGRRDAGGEGLQPAVRTGALPRRSADGTIANRLDSIYDTNELKAALSALAG